MNDATRFEYHWHVVRHAEDDDRLSTYDTVAALDYAADELSRMIDSEYESMHAMGESGDYESAWHAFLRMETYENSRADMRNMVIQSDPDPANRAPNYRDEPSQGPLWTIAAERVIGDANLNVGSGFQFYRCVCGDCRPGAWVIEIDGERTVTIYGAAEWEMAERQFKSYALYWAEQSDEDYEAVNDQELGSDLATVESIWADGDGPRRGQDTYTFRLNANDGDSVSLSLRFEPEQEPAER